MLRAGGQLGFVPVDHVRRLARQYRQQLPFTPLLPFLLPSYHAPQPLPYSPLHYTPTPRPSLRRQYSISITKNVSIDNTPANGEAPSASGATDNDPSCSSGTSDASHLSTAQCNQQNLPIIPVPSHATIAWTTRNRLRVTEARSHKLILRSGARRQLARSDGSVKDIQRLDADRWRRPALVRIVAWKLVKWIKRFCRRHGRNAIDWRSDVVPSTDIGLSSTIAVGEYSWPHVRSLIKTIKRTHFDAQALEDAIFDSLCANRRVDVGLYVILTYAAARVGDGEMAWQGLRRLAWLDATPTEKMFTRVISRLTDANEALDRSLTATRRGAQREVSMGQLPPAELERPLIFPGSSHRTGKPDVDATPVNWVERVAQLMHDEIVPVNALTATCRLAACARYGGRPALNEHALVQVQRSLAEQPPTSTVSYQPPAEPLEAIHLFERLVLLLTRLGIRHTPVTHGRVLDALLAREALEYALAWHLRTSQPAPLALPAPSNRLILPEAHVAHRPPAPTYVFSVGSQQNEQQQMHGWYQPDRLEASVKLHEAADPDTELPVSLAPCNRLLTSLLRAYRVDQAIAVYEDLKQIGAVPDRFTLGTMTFGCAKAGATEQLDRLMHDFRVFRLEMNIQFYNGLLSVLVHRGEHGAIQKLLSRLLRLQLQFNLRTFHLLLHACATTGDTQHARQLYTAMCDTHITPTSRTFAHLIDAYSRRADLDGAKVVMQELQLRQVPMSLSIVNSMLSAHARAADAAGADELFRWTLSQPAHAHMTPNMISYLWMFRTFYWQAYRQVYGHRRQRWRVHQQRQHQQLQTQLRASNQLPALPTPASQSDQVPHSAMLQLLAVVDHTTLMDIATSDADDDNAALSSPFTAVSLFRYMTFAPGAPLPTRIIYDTLLETLALQQDTAAFVLVWRHLLARAKDRRYPVLVKYVNELRAQVHAPLSE